jgi:hypothetical protein
MLRREKRKLALASMYGRHSLRRNSPTTLRSARAPARLAIAAPSYLADVASREATVIFLPKLLVCGFAGALAIGRCLTIFGDGRKLGRPAKWLARVMCRSMLSRQFCSK